MFLTGAYFLVIVEYLEHYLLMKYRSNTVTSKSSSLLTSYHYSLSLISLKMSCRYSTYITTNYVILIKMAGILKALKTKIS